MSILGNDDGWHFLPGNERQHYFYRNHTLCGIEIPSGSHHDNDPALHCEKCTQTQRKLMMVASSIAGKELKPEQVLDLITNLDKIINSRGLVDKVRTPEHAVAIVGHANGKTTTIDSRSRKKLTPDSHGKKKWLI